MSARRLLLMLAVAALLMLLSGCLLTTRVWNKVGIDPLRIEQASLDRSGVLWMTVAYADGKTWLVRADLGKPGARVRHTSLPIHKASRVGPAETSLRPSRVPVTIGRSPPGDAGTLHLTLSSSTGGSSRECFRVWVRGAGHDAYVDLPVWADWSGVMPYVALAMTPFTLAVDIVAAPVYVTWLVATVGGHGEPWLPWFR